MLGGDQTLWCFARYVSTVDQQVIVEHADGRRQLIDAASIHPLEPAAVTEGGTS